MRKKLPSLYGKLLKVMNIHDIKSSDEIDIGRFNEILYKHYKVGNGDSKEILKELESFGLVKRGHNGKIKIL